MEIKELVRFFLLILVAFAIGAYSIHLGQDTNWDLRNYHLYNPYAFLNNRLTIDLAPAGLQSYLNPFLDTLYFEALTHFNPKIVGFFLGFIPGLNFILIYKIAANVFRDSKSFSAFALALALTGIFSVGFISEIGTTLSDNISALFPLLSLWIILTSMDRSKERSRPGNLSTALAGLLVGVGCGLKLVISIYALAICLSLLSLPIHWKGRFKLAFSFGIFTLIGLFASNGYWMLKVWDIFGNPFFPAFNDIFHGKLAAPVAARDVRFLPKDIFEKIFYPAVFTTNPTRVSELPYKQVSWIFAYVSGLAFIIDRLWNRFRTEGQPVSPPTRIFISFFLVGYILWLNLFGIYRYLITLDLLVPLFLFVVINHFVKTPSARLGAIILLSILTLANSKGAPDFGHAAWGDSAYHVDPSALSTGIDPAAIYLASQPLAWIVPALDIKTPFIQITPNFFTTDSYWQRAKSIVAGRSGKSYVVFESESSPLIESAKRSLSTLGLSINENKCQHLNAYLGKAKFVYRYCEVSPTP